MVSNSLAVKSIVRGYHVYKTVWNPEINDKFDVCIDQYNKRDRYAMKIKIGNETVGHVPIELSKLVARCWNYKDVLKLEYENLIFIFEFLDTKTT